MNFSDLLALAQSYGTGNATWEQGDLNGDGSVNFADLLTLAQNYGKGTQPSLVLHSAARTRLRFGAASRA